MSSTETKPKFTVSLPVPGGQLQAAAWENDRETGDESFTSLGITISRRYFDEDEKKWKTAKSFRECDLLPLAFVTQELFRQLNAEKQKT